MENYLLFRTALEPLNKRVLEIEQSIYPRSLIEAGEEKMLYGTSESEFRNFYKSQREQGKLVTKIEFYNSLIEDSTVALFLSLLKKILIIFIYYLKNNILKIAI